MAPYILLLIVLLAIFKDVAEAASLGNDTTFEMENSNDNPSIWTRADVVKCDDQTPCPPYTSDQYKNECVLGICVLCAKYHSSCSRTEERGPSPCCKTPGKVDLLCRNTLDEGNRRIGMCIEDPCTGHELIAGYGIKGVYYNAKRCDIGYGKNPDLYQYVCVGKVCTECGAEGAPCQSDAECCKFATCQTEKKKKVCRRKCGDQGWICTDRKKYCCSGLSCAQYASGKFSCV